MDTTPAPKINDLKQRKAELDLKLDDLLSQKRKIENTLVDYRVERDKVNRQIKVSRKPLTISDHALIRYLERSVGVNTDEIRQSILDTIGSVSKLGNGKFPIGDGIRAVVKDRVVVTIID